MDEINVKIGAILRDIRIEKGLTMKELGKKVGATEQAIYYYETGKSGISLRKFFNICEVLDINPSEIQRQVMRK